MRALSIALNVLRIPVAIAVVIGLMGVFFAGAEGEFRHVLGLIASGIVMNGAALIVLIWIWRRFQARRVLRHSDKGDP